MPRKTKSQEGPSDPRFASYSAFKQPNTHCVGLPCGHVVPETSRSAHYHRDCGGPQFSQAGPGPDLG